VPPTSRAGARWGIRGRAALDAAAGVALLATTAGLWIAFLLSVW
jgi:hypothetical protein